VSATPSPGHRFPRAVIALAARRHVRYRLRYADVAELLAERGSTVAPSPVYAWVREFAPLDEDAARPYRHGVGSARGVDEPYVNVAGGWASVYRAPDKRGQIADVDVSAQRAAGNAAISFRRASASTGAVPDEVTTDGAAGHPPALAAVLPRVRHETGKAVRRRVERDHRHLKGRLRGLRGFKTLAGARTLCRAQAFLRNLRSGFYDLGHLVEAVAAPPQPPVVQAWAALTGTRLGR
jgi:transposase-like protein